MENRMNRILKHLSSNLDSDAFFFVLRMDHREHIHWVMDNFRASLRYVPSPGLPPAVTKRHSLTMLVWWKLLTRSPQADCDVIAMYIRRPRQTRAARKHLPLEFQRRLDELIALAESQMDNDPWRHPEKYMKRKLRDGTVIDLSN